MGQKSWLWLVGAWEGRDKSVQFLITELFVQVTVADYVLTSLKPTMVITSFGGE